MRGVVELRIGRDRPGHVRQMCGHYRKGDHTQVAARIVIDSTENRTTVTIEPWSAGSQRTSSSAQPGLDPHKINLYRDHQCLPHYARCPRDICQEFSGGAVHLTDGSKPRGRHRERRSTIDDREGVPGVQDRLPSLALRPG